MLAIILELSASRFSILIFVVDLAAACYEIKRTLK